MLQNREVGGATMGAGRGMPPGQAAPRETGQILFGPWAYLNLAVVAVLCGSYVWALTVPLSDPFGLGWSWTLLAVLALNYLIAWLSQRYGAGSDRRHRARPHDAVYWGQRLAPFVIAVPLLVALVGVFTHAPVLVAVMIAVTWGLTAGGAPTYFQPPPPAVPAPSQGATASSADARTEDAIHP